MPRRRHPGHICLYVYTHIYMCMPRRRHRGHIGGGRGGGVSRHGLGRGRRGRWRTADRTPLRAPSGTSSCSLWHLCANTFNSLPLPLLQPPSPTVAARSIYGCSPNAYRCSLQHLRLQPRRLPLQPALPTVAGGLRTHVTPLLACHPLVTQVP